MSSTRRVGLYFAWSRPREVNVDLGVLENRYPTLWEFRRALWPLFERLRDPKIFNQTIKGFLDHVILEDFEQFRAVVRDATGHEVAIVQREGEQLPTHNLDDDF